MYPLASQIKKLTPSNEFYQSFTLREPFFIEKVPLLCNFHGQTGFFFTYLESTRNKKTIILSRLSMIVRVTVVLDRNVVNSKLFLVFAVVLKVRRS